MSAAVDRVWTRNFLKLPETGPLDLVAAFWTAHRKTKRVNEAAAAAAAAAMINLDEKISSEFSF
jgi:hypothetical protein